MLGREGEHLGEGFSPQFSPANQGEMEPAQPVSNGLHRVRYRGGSQGLLLQAYQSGVRVRQQVPASKLLLIEEFEQILGLGLGVAQELHLQQLQLYIEFVHGKDTTFVWFQMRRRE